MRLKSVLLSCAVILALGALEISATTAAYAGDTLKRPPAASLPSGPAASKPVNCPPRTQSATKPTNAKPGCALPAKPLNKLPSYTG